MLFLIPQKIIDHINYRLFHMYSLTPFGSRMVLLIDLYFLGEVSMRELYKEWYQESDRDFDKVWIVEIAKFNLGTRINSIRPFQVIYRGRRLPELKECFM